jgi:outer membrane protein assembly factor BamB
MHKSKISLFFVFILLALLLTACSGVPMSSGWPMSLVDGKTIYTASGSHIYAVNVDTGKEQTPRRFPEKVEGATVFGSAPILVDGYLFAGDYNNHLWKIPTSFVQEEWKKNDSTGRFIASPELFGELILAPNADHNLYAYDSKGIVKWKFTASNGLWTKPSISGDLIIVSSMDKKVYALRQNTNKDGVDVVWSKDLGGSVLFSQALGEDGNLYIGTLNNELFSIEAASGKVNWQVKTAGTVWSPVVVGKDKIYAGDQSGKIFALNTKDGSQAWEVNAESAVIGGLTLTDKGLFAGTEKGTALCLSVDGTKIWTETVGGKLYSTPVISGDYVIFGVFEGDKTLAAYYQDGRSAWTFTPSK